MKDRRKGFTLVEMLMVVAIMGALGVVITISLTHTLQNTQQKKCDDFVTEVEDAACVYSGLSNKEIVCTRTNCAPIKLEILVKEGKVVSEVDACTGNAIDLEETVTVTWDSNGEKICTYNGDRTYGE